MKIELEFPDTVDPDQVAVEARKAWLRFHIQPGESLQHVAKRLGFSYRQIRYIAQMQFSGQPASAQVFNVVTSKGCQFCESTTDLHEHHVVNRKASDTVVLLCKRCHGIFHLLNNMYRRP